MSADPGADERLPAARRLTLTPIGFDIVIALGQDPAGLRLSTLAHAIGSPVSSVQAVLRVLVANGLVLRNETSPPDYRLAPDHPGREALEQLALVLPEPAHAVGIALRASPAIEIAVVDAAGFIAGIVPAAHADDRDRLERALATVGRARTHVPDVELHEAPDLRRLLSVSIGFRDRVRRAILLKGRIPRDAGGPRRPASEPEPEARAEAIG